MGLILAACGSDSTPSGAVDAPINTGAAPVISELAWTHTAGCQAGIAHQVTITVDATDADTPEGQLTYSGSFSSCTGTITGATSTITCPEAASYPGTVTVKDPQNHSTSKGGTITPCTNGSSH